MSTYGVSEGGPLEQVVTTPRRLPNGDTLDAGSGDGDGDGDVAETETAETDGDEAHLPDSGVAEGGGEEAAAHSETPPLVNPEP